MSFFPINSAPVAQYENFILNARALVDTTGWNTFKDADQATPVDGTGGSPTLTFTRTTSAPLEGPASFLITTTAANLRGEGVSDDFTISAAQRAKVLTISFDYAFDVTQATGDWTVWILDVTNNVLIQPAGFQVQGGVNGQAYKHIATFQASSNSTSYRLIIFRAVTTATAVNFKIDNVQVGPQVVQYGAPVTDWVSYTPTGGWTGGNVTYTGRWRRIGDSAEIQVHVALTGAPSGTFLTINLPSGMVIDTSKIPSSSGDKPLGLARASDSGVKGYDGTVNYFSTTAVLALAATGASPPDYAGIQPSIPFSFGNADSVSVLFTVPIVGWSSTVQMSNDTDTRVVSFSGYKPSSEALTANTTNVAYTTIKDSHGAWNGTQYTVPVPGDYEVTVGGACNSTSAALLYVDGSLYAEIYNINSGTNTTGTVSVYNLRAGQIISIRSSASNTFNGGASTNANRLTIRRLSGPSAIAASEGVGYQAFISSISVTTGGSEVPLNTFSVQLNTHGTGSATGFTVPVSGLYMIGLTGGSGPGSATKIIYVKKNGSNIMTAPGDVGSYTSFNGTTLARLNAGDVLTVVGVNFAATENWGINSFWVTKVGN